ncbi:MAG TPA: hypothetical protein VNQ14_06885 [Woeseiaceae bacterium]|nr:hypothetical protein [Woeseiaceae bacterium]
MRSSSLCHPVVERYVFRPFGELAAFGSVTLFMLFSGMSAQSPRAESASGLDQQPPTLMLSVAGDIQQGVHVNYDLDRRQLYRNPALVAPLHPVEVSPHEWVKIYTNSPLGLPLSARAQFYASARPEPCFGNVMIGCVEVDIENRGHSIPLHAGAASSFGFAAPSAPGSYWIALDAAWGFGGGTQVFLIDVRA